jgi:hypothetical protein
MKIILTKKTFFATKKNSTTDNKEHALTAPSREAQFAKDVMRLSVWRLFSSSSSPNDSTSGLLYIADDAQATTVTVKAAKLLSCCRRCS